MTDLATVTAPLRRATLTWLVLFAALHIYWDICEAADPDQQFADPLLPCVGLALSGAALSLPVWLIAQAPSRD